MNKSFVGLIVSSVLTLGGICLRLKAHSIAWRGWSSFSGPASETSWGREEIAIGQIALAFVAVGLLLCVVTYIRWLFAKDSSK